MSPRVVLLFTAVACMAPACPPPPAPPEPGVVVVVPAEGGAGDVYDQACAALAAARCPEGLFDGGDGCARTMRRNDHVITDFFPACVADAGANAAKIRACGPSIKCATK